MGRLRGNSKARLFLLGVLMFGVVLAQSRGKFGTIQGRVVDKETGRGFANVRIATVKLDKASLGDTTRLLWLILAEQVPGVDYQLDRTVFTDSNGRYAVKAVRAGYYGVFTYDKSHEWSLSVVNVNPGKIAHADFWVYRVPRALPGGVVCVDPDRRHGPILGRLNSLGKLDYSVKIGWLSADTALLYKVYAIFDTLRLPKEYRSHHPIRCGTPVILEVQRRWARLSPEIRVELLKYFTYLGKDTTKVVPAIPNLNWKVWHKDNYRFCYVLEGEHKIDNRDADNNGIPDYLEELQRQYEFAWQKEITEYGYDKVPDNLLPVRVYIFNCINGYAYPCGLDSVINLLDNDWVDADRKVFTAHELFHAIQFSSYDQGEAMWWVEGTAYWMEDEVWDNFNYYVAQIQYFTGNPEWSLNDINDNHEYGSLIFPKLLAERKGVELIRLIWNACRLVQGNTATWSVAFALGQNDLRPIQDFFKSFVCANYIKTGVDGYGDDAAITYPDVLIEQTYLPAHNHHYGKARPANIGDPVPWEEGNFPPPSNKAIALPHLGCHYIGVVKPVQIDDNAMLYFNFDGGGEKRIWAVPFVKVKNDKSLEKDEIILIGNRAANYAIPLGGNDPKDNAEIIFIPTNIDTFSPVIPYKYSFAIVPVFQKSYQENPKNGSTQQVLNVDKDNWYKPEDRVRLKVDLSDKVHAPNGSTLTADFSKVDHGFDPAKVKISETDIEKHEYLIEYEFSNTLATPNQLWPVIIRVKDLTNDPNHQPKETIINLRVEGPPVIEDTDPGRGAEGVDIYKHVRVKFSQAMDPSSMSNSGTQYSIIDH